jgi:hypothetical protein
MWSELGAFVVTGVAGAAASAILGAKSGIRTATKATGARVQEATARNVTQATPKEMAATVDFQALVREAGTKIGLDAVNLPGRGPSRAPGYSAAKEELLGRAATPKEYTAQAPLRVGFPDREAINIEIMNAAATVHPTPALNTQLTTLTTRFS